MIDATEIDELFRGCLFKEEELEGGKPEGAVIVQGIYVQYAFEPKRLEATRQKVMGYLKELPRGFRHTSEAESRSFLDGCMTESGEQWGEHRNVEQLFSLAIGLQLGGWLLPKELWSLLPGGLPYFQIRLPEGRTC